MRYRRKGRERGIFLASTKGEKKKRFRSFFFQLEKRRKNTSERKKERED